MCDIEVPLKKSILQNILPLPSLAADFKQRPIAALPLAAARRKIALPNQQGFRARRRLLGIAIQRCLEPRVFGYGGQLAISAEFESQ